MFFNVERPIRLRDLPGISRIEQMLKVRELVTEPGLGRLMEAVDKVSIALFSIGIPETYWELDGDEDPEEEAEQAEYEAQFQNVMKPYRVTAPFWSALGWDITDGKGDELGSAIWFGRQIIALEGELVEGVKFHPYATGTLRDEEVEEQDVERWGDELRRQAEEWMKGRGG